MENQSEAKIESATPKIVLAAAVSFVIAAAVAGGAVWCWKNKEAARMKKNYETQIKNLTQKNVADTTPAETEEISLPADPRNENFEKELANKYNVSSADVVSLSVDKESGDHLQGTFSYKASGGGKLEIVFLAHKSTDGVWQIVFDGNSFMSLMKCDVFRKNSFPDEFKEYSDCDISEFSRLQPGWKLVSGNPRRDCSRTVYEGNVTVRGWYEWDYVYVEKDWIFKVLPADVSKITTNPENQWYTQYRLADASPELEAKLRKSSQKKPLEVTLKGLSFYCEGIAGASLAPGSEAFRD